MGALSPGPGGRRAGRRAPAPRAPAPAGGKRVAGPRPREPRPRREASGSLGVFGSSAKGGSEASAVLPRYRKLTFVRAATRP